MSDERDEVRKAKLKLRMAKLRKRFVRAQEKLAKLEGRRRDRDAE